MGLWTGGEPFGITCNTRKADHAASQSSQAEHGANEKNAVAPCRSRGGSGRHHEPKRRIPSGAEEGVRFEPPSMWKGMRANVPWRTSSRSHSTW